MSHTWLIFLFPLTTCGQKKKHATTWCACPLRYVGLCRNTLFRKKEIVDHMWLCTPRMVRERRSATRGLSCFFLRPRVATWPVDWMPAARLSQFACTRGSHGHRWPPRLALASGRQRAAMEVSIQARARHEAGVRFYLRDNKSASSSAQYHECCSLADFVYLWMTETKPGFVGALLIDPQVRQDASSKPWSSANSS